MLNVLRIYRSKQMILQRTNQGGQTGTTCRTRATEEKRRMLAGLMAEPDANRPPGRPVR